MTNRKYTDKNALLTRSEYEGWLEWLKENSIDPFKDWRNHQAILKEGQYWLWVANKAPYWRFHTLFVPKRYFKEWGDMTVQEMAELMLMLKNAINKMRTAKLERADGTLIEKYVFFWRLRDNTFDPISGNDRPTHFHLHLAPDRDHLWDSTLEEDAHKVDILGILS
jgi:diadenosine tetraphosphate (Ap4A) HIT family hydrolase